MLVAVVLLGLLPLVAALVTGIGGILASVLKEKQQGKLHVVNSRALKEYEKDRPRTGVTCPGRLVTSSRRAVGLIAEDLAEQGLLEGNINIQAPPRQRRIKTRSVTWQQRTVTEDSNWREGNPGRLQLLQSSASMLAARHAQLHAQEATAVQSWLMGTWALHSCPGMPKDAAGAEAAGLQEYQLHCRQVEYVGMRGRSMMKFPAWKCSHCQHLQQASPEAAGCFPSTPVQPNRLYSMEVLHLYGGLKPKGMSMDG